MESSRIVKFMISIVLLVAGLGFHIYMVFRFVVGIWQLLADAGNKAV